MSQEALAVPVLVLSLVRVVVQMSQIFFLSPTLEVMGPSSVVMPMLVTAGAIFLVGYSRSARAKAWIG